MTAARPSTPDLVIAGIGASAGGLEAFSQVLEALPEDPGLAIVLVQHLAPQHESALPALLAGRTRLPVVQATEGIPVEVNHVYVIPPNVQMGITDAALHLLPRPSDRSQYKPIDYFLHSLAAAAQERGIAVILSGTASDGTAGVREVKAVGGITIAQDPRTARYAGMPSAAIDSGLVDLVGAPDAIAAELVGIARHLREHLAPAAPVELPAERSPPARDALLEQVFTLLRNASGVDFRTYKRPTIERRLQRRMALHKLPRLEHYIKLLRENPGEVHALYNDILIHVTNFFRERESFAALESQVYPHLVENRCHDDPIRVWIPGCSTGEEAYSVAISLLQWIGDHEGGFPIQIFATDIAEAALEQARAGRYSETIATDVSPEQLRRFFDRADGGYRIAKSVRDVCIFARQDVTRDPPFSRLDLILCRNVLIYMGTELQRKLVLMFHYALKPTGYLVLGKAETTGPQGEMFEVVDRKYRIYQKKPGAGPLLHFDESATSRRGRAEHTLPGAGRRDEGPSIEREASHLVQERYAPPGVVVDANLNVVQFRGQTGHFLEPAPGEPNINVLKMAREGLLHDLRSALQQARKTKTSVRRRGLRVKSDGGWRDVAIDVHPLLGTERPHYLVLFDSRRHEAAEGRGRREPARVVERPDRRVARLQQELASSREYLQSIIQEVEAANEELQSANEEVLSANEELQSTNEELDTAKEELQSTNEELNTVNEELHVRNEELSRVNSDLVNLLGSVQIAIVIVAGDLRIRRFTPMAERVLNLIPSDVGRPIAHIKPNIECPELEDLIVQVMNSVTPLEREVHDQQGVSYSLRIRPYKNVENRIDGAVLALFESEKHGGARAQRAMEHATAIVEAVRQPLVLLDDALRVRAANPAFCNTFSLRADDIRGRPLREIADGRWWADLRTLLEDGLRHDPRPSPIEVEYDVPGAGRRRVVVEAQRIGAAEEHDGMVLIAVDEPTRPRKAG